MLKNFIKINLLLFIFIITKNDGMDPEKDTIEYFLRGSGAFDTTNSLIQEVIYFLYYLSCFYLKYYRVTIKV